MKTMNRVLTVTLDEATYLHLSTLAQEKHIDVEAEVLQAIRAYLRQQRSYREDPFFQIGPDGHSDLGDLSENHDKYLYG